MSKTHSPTLDVEICIWQSGRVFFGSFSSGLSRWLTPYCSHFITVNECVWPIANKNNLKLIQTQTKFKFKKKTPKYICDERTQTVRNDLHPVYILRTLLIISLVLFIYNNVQSGGAKNCWSFENMKLNPRRVSIALHVVPHCNIRTR